MSRNSVSLSCQRFVGSHTYDAVAKKIFYVHKGYDLDVNKITATITDNASNIGNAFKEYVSNASETTAAQHEHMNGVLTGTILPDDTDAEAFNAEATDAAASAAEASDSEDSDSFASTRNLYKSFPQSLSDH